MNIGVSFTRKERRGGIQAGIEGLLVDWLLNRNVGGASTIGQDFLAKLLWCSSIGPMTMEVFGGAQE